MFNPGSALSSASLGMTTTKDEAGSFGHLVQRQCSYGKIMARFLQELCCVENPPPRGTIDQKKQRITAIET